ncbi:MAG: multidrug effflux MFS transporter [Gammaproteobacteria bacterium]
MSSTGVVKAIKLPEFIALFALMTSLTALSIDAMLPALPEIAQNLSVTNTNDTQLVVSMFILGMVFGESVFGPISDAIGRKKTILIGIAIYCCGAVLAMTAQSMTLLLVGRIVQGIGVSGPKIASRALIRDQYEGNAMARIMSFIMMIFIIVPMVAPALGQLILLFAGWRAIFFLFLLLAITVAVWLGWRQPETLPAERRIPFSIPAIIRTTGLVLKHSKVMAYTVTAGLVFGVQVTYLSTSQAMFQDFYNAGKQFPLYFAILALGIGMASILNSQLVMRIGMHRLTVNALVGLIFLSCLLLLVGLLTEGVPPFSIFMPVFFLIFFCMGILFGNINAMAMQWLGRIAGLGASLIASVSSLIAVAVSVSVGKFYNGTVFPLAIGYLVCAMIALLLVLSADKSRLGEI